MANTSFSVADVRNIFSHPVSLKDYRDAPEISRTWRFSDNTPHMPDWEADELGLEPRVERFGSDYSRVGELYVHELKDVLFFRGLILTRDGGYFRDCLRRPPGHDSGFALAEKLRVHLHRLSGGRFFSPEKRGAFRIVVPTALKSHMENLGGGRFSFTRQPASYDVRVIDEPAMTFFTGGGYGHIILEPLPCLWYADRMDGEPPTLMLHPNYRAVPDFIRLACRPFSRRVRELRISPRESILHFRRLYIASKPFTLKSYMSERAREIWQTIAAYYADTPSPCNNPRIYLSRSATRKRVLDNETQVEDFFKKRGFAVIHPERLSFPEQIALVSQATHIAGPFGSALHNIVFSRNPQNVRLLGFQPPLIFAGPKVLAQIEALHGRRLAYIQGVTHTDRSFGGRSWRQNTRWTIDMKKLERGFRDWA